MVWFIILYCVFFSIICYFSLNFIYKSKLKEIENKYSSIYSNLKNDFNELEQKQNKKFIGVKNQILNENKYNLDKLNKDITQKLKNLSTEIRNRPLI